MKHPLKCLFWSLPISLLLWAVILSPLWAATYYLRADGTVTAANKANATGCGATTTAMNITQHNAATFSGDDIITVCDSGGVFTDGVLTPPSSGSSGHLISYIPSGSPVIKGANTLSSWTSEAGGSNLVANPEAFNLWTLTNHVTVSANVSTPVDPNGGTAADGLIADATTNDHYVQSSGISVTAGNTYSASIWAAPGGYSGNMLAVLWFDSGWGYISATTVFFDTGVLTHAIGLTGGPTPTPFMSTTPVNGFYREGYTVTAPATAAHALINFYASPSNGTTTFLGDGSTVMSNMFGAVLEATSTTQYGTAYYKAASTEPQLLWQTYPTSLVKVATKKELFYGSFWWDSGNSRIYIKTTTLGNPSGFTMEAGQRRQGVLINNKNYISVSGLEITRSNWMGVLLNGGATYNKITRCKIHDGGGSGVGISGASHNDIYYNLIYDMLYPSPVGPYYNGIDNNSTATYNTIYNNTIRSIYGASVSIETSSSNYTVKNNILDSTTNTGGALAKAVYVDNTTSSLTFGNNDYLFTTNLGWWLTENVTTLGAWTTLTSETGSISSNPLFVSTVTPDFHLQSNSPAINAGVSVGLTSDYDGNAIAGPPDIGAYERRPVRVGNRLMPGVAATP